VTVSSPAAPKLDSFVDALRAPIVNQRARGRRAVQRRLEPREVRAESFAAFSFLAVAAAMAVGLATNRPFDAATAGILVVAYALVRQVRFDVGVGFAVATQLVFVPMLFLLPAPVLPLAVATGSLLGTGIDVLLRGAHPERAVVAVANGWFAVGPALVFALTGVTEPLWWICVVAFAAQLAGDLAASTAREWMCSAISPHFQARVIGLIAVVDALLWPVGLLTALAAHHDPLLTLLVLPLAALLALVAHERTARLKQVDSQTSKLERATSRIGETFASGLDREATLAIVIDTAIDATEATTGRVTYARGGDLHTWPGQHGSDDAWLQAAERLALGVACDAETPVVIHESAMAVALCALAQEDAEQRIVLSVARAERPFTDTERDRFHDLARQAAVSLDNVARHERLARQATTDELTGLLNHRALHEALVAALESGSRFRPSVGLVMLDIDDFKRINDVYGHQRGDEVLYAVARAVESAAREDDHVARYGGEELAVVLPHADLAQAERVAERIRERIAAVAVALPDGDSIRPTASLGVAVSPGYGDKEALIAAADEALYGAKRSGKNRTVCTPHAPSQARAG
jgi:diguanylate cyclase (GGDEF)-like protein